MAIQKWSENILIVDLPPEPNTSEELNSALQMVREDGNFDVIVDFAGVDIITSSSISALLNLEKILDGSDKNLLLVNISRETRNVFSVSGIEQIFKFVDDKFTALASLQMVKS
jgi:anti-anti-sigma factor